MALRVRAGVGVLTGAGAAVLAAGPVQGVEVLGVGVGQGVEVSLGGGDLGVAHPVHDGFEVGTAGEQPGGMSVAEVMDADVEVDSGDLDGGQPDAGAEGVPRDRGALAGREQQIVGTQAPGGDPVGQLGDQVGRQAQGAGLVVLGGRAW